MFEPLISIIIPSQNNAKTIEVCLQSIKRSKYPHYEIIVVDRGSKDQTVTIAQKHTNKVYRINKNDSESAAYNRGVEAAHGDVYVFLKAEMCLRPETLSQIVEYFGTHTHIHIVTGKLSKRQPQPNFISQYKSLSDHYIASQQPRRVNFLLPYISAIRKEVFEPFDINFKSSSEAELGLRFAHREHRLVLMQDLEISQLKRYGFLFLMASHLSQSVDWGKLFFQYKGWLQLFDENRPGFAYVPRSQIISVLVIPIIIICFFVMPFDWTMFFCLILLAGLWIYFNYKFCLFLIREKKILFTLKSIPLLFCEQFFTLLGVSFGLLKRAFR